MEFALIVVFLVIAMVLFLKSRSRSAQQRKAARKSKSKKSSSANESTATGSKAFTAVTVVPCPGACEAVLGFGEHRFLTAEAPILPLSDCGLSSCTCKYVYYDDRRDVSEERRQPYSIRTDLHSTTGEKEKRQRAGRRKSDKT